MAKTIAITGSTGGILSHVCIELVKKNYNLILINRNLEKSENQKKQLLEINNVNIDIIKADMLQLEDVKAVVNELKDIHFDYLILASAIYNVKLKKMDTGYNNVFQVNFVSPYYLANKLLEIKPELQVVVVGSIAYNYQQIDTSDIDLSNSPKQTHIYGNSKRFLMFSLMKKYPNYVSIAHPGITGTNLTNHYPKWINWFVTFGIKIVFPSNKKAGRNIIYALDHKTGYKEWIGPRTWNLYGKPKIKKIKKIEDTEINQIFEISESIYQNIK